MKRKNVRAGAVLPNCILLLLAMFLTGASAAANFFAPNFHFVTTLDDGGPGSLRDAIATAQAGDSILFAVKGTIVLTSGELLIGNNITIIGPGATKLAISTGGQSRVLEILTNNAVVLSDVTICDGRAADGAAGTSNSPVGGDGSDGGGIYNAGFLALAQCVVSNCVAGNGGAGYFLPDFQGSSIPDGTNWVGGAGGRGGAVYNAGGVLLTRCSLISNSSGVGGAGGGARQYGTWGNVGGGGGAIYNAGAMALTACAFERNVAGSGGAGYIFYNVGGGPFDGGEHGGAGGNGGAVCDAGQTTTFVSQCQFGLNASGAGGIGTSLAQFSVANVGGPGGDGGAGGAIWTGGRMRVSDCTFLSNQTGEGGGGGFGINSGGAGGVGGSGGAICAMGALNLTRCSCASNNAGTGGNGGTCGEAQGGSGGSGGGGGAIYSASALVLDECTFSSNSAGGGGGGASTPGGSDYFNPTAGYGGIGGSGGALYCQSDSREVNCTFDNNQAGNAGAPGTGGFNPGFSFQYYPSGSNGGQGGCIFGAGSLDLRACTVSYNVGGNGSSASGSGGPLAAGNASSPSIPENLPDTNSSPNDIEFFDTGGPGGAGGAGGIYSESDLNLVLCTLSGNVGGGGGWGSFGSSGGDGGPGATCCASSNELFLVACTVAGNTGGPGGVGDRGGAGGAGGTGGIPNTNGAASASLINTIVAANFAGVGGAGGYTYSPFPGPPGSNGAADLQGSFTSLGYNLIGNADGSSGFTNGVDGDLAGSTSAPIDPVLGPLADNGGPTFTMALLHGSPALDAGDDALLLPPYSLRTDQRGFPRKSGPHVDIGAFEYQYPNYRADRWGQGPTLSGTLVANGSPISNAGSISSDSGSAPAAQSFQLTFSDDTPGGTFSVLASTNLSLPVNEWSIVGQPIQVGPGLYQFTDGDSANTPERFYRVSSP